MTVSSRSVHFGHVLNFFAFFSLFTCAFVFLFVVLHFGLLAETYAFVSSPLIFLILIFLFISIFLFLILIFFVGQIQFFGFFFFYKNFFRFFLFTCLLNVFLFQVNSFILSFLRFRSIAFGIRSLVIVATFLNCIFVVVKNVQRFISRFGRRGFFIGIGINFCGLSLLVAFLVGVIISRSYSFRIISILLNIIIVINVVSAVDILIFRSRFASFRSFGTSFSIYLSSSFLRSSSSSSISLTIIVSLVYEVRV